MAKRQRHRETNRVPKGVELNPCYLKEARAMLEGKNTWGKNRCVKLPEEDRFKNSKNDEYVQHSLDVRKYTYENEDVICDFLRWFIRKYPDAFEEKYKTKERYKNSIGGFTYTEMEMLGDEWMSKGFKGTLEEAIEIYEKEKI